MSDKDQKNIPNESEAADDDNIENLSQTEKAAFEKIIAEISEKEGQDVDASSPADKTLPSKEADSDSAAAANVTDEHQSDDKNGDKGDENLSDDQQAALDKIMTEISDKNSESPADSKTEEANTPDEAQSDDEQSALNKIMDEINSDEANVSQGDDKKGDEEALSDDEQAALDNIMAEINSDETKEAESNHQKNDDDALTDDQQAALDNIMAEIKDDETEEAEGDDQKAGDDALSDDEQAALDNNMAEIKDDETEEAEGDNQKADNGSLTDDQQAALEKIMADIESNDQQSDASTPQQADNESKDDENRHGLSMEEFDDELSSLLSNSSQNSSADVHTDNQAADPKAAPSQDRSLEDINSALKSIVRESDEDDKPPSEDADTADSMTTDPEPAAEKSKESSGSLKEVAAPAQPEQPNKTLAARFKKPIISIGIACTAILCAAGAYGLYAHYFKPAIPEQAALDTSENLPPDTPVAQEETPPADETIEPDSDHRATDLAVAAQDPPKASPFEILKNDIESVRQSLQLKKEEVLDLKQYYQKGIKEERTKLLAIQSPMPKSFTSAMGNRRIELGLRSIQRRTDYNSKLDTPLGQIEAYLEQLLYLERRIRIFELLDNAISGLSLSDLKRQGTALINSIRKGSDTLSIEQVKSTPPSLESIWQGLASNKDTPTDGTSSAPSRLSAVDQQISKSICNGSYERKYLLTALTGQTAECLAQWPGKDLYLNSLTHLSPKAAKELSQWPGEWLSLNGIKSLPSESARYLSQWPGKRLSLNGVKRLSREATTHLAEWQGDQLEMIGLTSIGRWENYVTHLYLSEEMRQKLQVQ